MAVNKSQSATAATAGSAAKGRLDNAAGYQGIRLLKLVYSNLLGTASL